MKDTDPMPFGEHKGKRMQDVPVKYLHWLWHNGLKDNPRALAIPVAQYIRENLNALRMEDKDLIWT